MNSPFKKKTYTINEISKILSIPEGNIKRWEKDFEGLLTISRTKQGARYYTDKELDFLKNVKEMRENNISVKKIKESLSKQREQTKEVAEKSPPPLINGQKKEFNSIQENVPKTLDPILNNLLEKVEYPKESIKPQGTDVVSQNNQVDQYHDKNVSNKVVQLSQYSQVDQHEKTNNYAEEFETSIITRITTAEIDSKPEQPNLEEFFKIMDAYKQSLIDEVKLEIRNGIRKEVIEEVKKEISKGQVQTVKTLSNSIYKLSENTKAELQELSNIISETSENTTENIVTLSHVITATTENTAESIEALSNQITENSENNMDNFVSLSQIITSTSESTYDTLESLSNQITTNSENTTDNLVTLSHIITTTSENTTETIESLTNRIMSNSESATETLETLSQKIASTSEDTKETIQSLAEKFANASKNTNETFVSLSKTISQVSDQTHHELSNLVDAINKDREMYYETLHAERMHYKKEIRSREAVFQEMVASFRNTAAAKDLKGEKKWWKFWK